MLPRRPVNRTLPLPHKRLQLMITCLCDAFYADVAQASVEILEHLGCEIEFPEAQTCCGQPAFNSGDWEAARRVIRHTETVFGGNLPIVVPSGSCSAMLQHGNALCFERQPDLPQIVDLGRRAWEIVDYIVNGLGVRCWPGRLAARAAFHASCHSRGSRTTEAASRLLSTISGLELLHPNEPEQCCGFGGSFAVTFPHISTSMGNLKIENLLALEPDFVVSADMSCLMHQQGLAQKQGRPLTVRHFVQVLRDALRNGGFLGPA